MGRLTLLLALPLLGAALIALLPRDNRGLIRRVAVAAVLVTGLLAWSLVLGFDLSASGMQYAETVKWNPRLGTYYALGVDGVSLPLVMLATLLCLVAVLASRSIRERPKGYYMLLLVLEGAMLGVFMAQDWALFYVFWELTLIPLFFLIDRWGGKNRHGASLNFVLYTMGGSVFMLIALLVLFDAVPGHSFAMADMIQGARALPEETQVLIFLGFLIGFGVKMPIFPFHGWLPLAHVEAPSPVSILLSGILLKMGSYGLLRAVYLLPGAALALQEVLLAIALIGLIYGGLLAWRQTDLKAMIAYSSISHMGVVLVGIATLNLVGITGAVMQMVAHGLVAGALFLLIGLLYERTHTRDIRHYSSLVRVMPRFAFFTTLAFMAAVGLPGSASFVAELHTLIGGFSRWGWLMVVISIGVLISAAYAVRTVQRLFTGPVRAQMRSIPDLTRSELIAAAVLTTGTLLIGLFPAPALRLTEATAAHLSAAF
jgi:NADH-quinone oxidoreductase subunit M